MRFFLLAATLAWSMAVLADTATVVDGPRVNMRSGNTESARVIRSLQPGTPLEVLRIEQDYVQVRTAQGEVGWLPARLLRISKSNPVSEASDARVRELEAQLAQARAALAQAPKPQPKGYAAWVVALVAVGALILGVVLGMAGLEAYYRKRLNGLRI